jgi:hypothetical protein
VKLSELETALKRYGFDDEDPLSTWLNAAKNEIVDEHDWPFLISRTTVVLPALTNTLPSLTNFFKVISIRDQETGRPKLEYYEPTRYEREIDDFAVSGIPRIYTTFDGSSIEAWPRPDVDRSLRVVFHTLVPDMSGPDDVPGLPLGLHYAIVQRAASIALQAENEEERAQTAQSEYATALDRAIRKYTATTDDEPRQVVETW